MAEDFKKKFLVLLTINAWGVATTTENNAIRKASIEDFKKLANNYPSTVIEVGSDRLSSRYRNLGSGRVVDGLNSGVSLSNIIDRSGLGQIKIADSENFPLLSVFFNNQEEKFDNEDWEILKNKKNFRSLFYSPDELVAKRVVSVVKAGKHSFVMANFNEIAEASLNGQFEQAVLKAEKTSRSLKKISQAVLEEDGVLIILGSFGAAEDVFNINTKIPNFKKTTNPVPLIIVGREFEGKTIGLEEAPNNDLSLISPQGFFTDIAPTILKILDLDIPPEMTGESFV